MRDIVIENKEKLYNRLFLYKTFLYNNVHFITSIEDEELKGIIDALNIKNRSKRIEYIYDYSCKKIDKFYEGKNICGFKNGQCLSHQREGCTLKNGCCRICAFQSENGCTTSNISCKLFYCDLIKRNNKILRYKDIKIFKLYTFRQRLMIMDGFFADREEFLLDLKIGMIIYHSIGCAYRLFRNSMLLRRKNKLAKKRAD